MVTKQNVLLAVLLSIYSLSCNYDRPSEPMLCDKNDIVSSKLITVSKAIELLESDNRFIPVEVSKDKEYASGHIPGALNVWRPDFRSKSFQSYGGMICNQNEFLDFLQTLGMDNGTTLLLYDNKGGCDAMRLAWVFDFYGFKAYRVINGGKSSWVKANLALDTIPSFATKNEAYHFSVHIDSSVYATYSDVLSALNSEQTLLIDTREFEEYLGLPIQSKQQILPFKNGAFARGSIPGAIHLNWSDMSDLADDHRIKCRKDLLYNLAQKGIDKDKNIIVYCQSGSRSSHTSFILRELLEYPNVKNYDGSWIEWSYMHMNGGNNPIEQLTSQEDFDIAFKKLNSTLN